MRGVLDIRREYGSSTAASRAVAEPERRGVEEVRRRVLHARVEGGRRAGRTGAEQGGVVVRTARGRTDRLRFDADALRDFSARLRR